MMHRFSASSFYIFRLMHCFSASTFVSNLKLHYFTRTTRYLLVLQKI